MSNPDTLDLSADELLAEHGIGAAIDRLHPDNPTETNVSTANPDPEVVLTDDQLLAILNRYHEIARGNGALELVAAEIAGHGLPEIVDEVRDTAAELGIDTSNLSALSYRRLTTAVRNYGTRLAAELDAAKLEPGEKVRVRTASEDVRLGVMRDLDAVGFVGSAPGGIEGTFRGMHPNERLSGWALVDIDPQLVELAEGWTLEELGNPETLLVPVHAAAVERIQ